MNNEELSTKLKEQIIAALNLEDITPADIDNDAPLFGDGLGLDSIDALELILILEKEYGIHIDNAAEARPIFKSINSLVNFIVENSK